MTNARAGYGQGSDDIATEENDMAEQDPREYRGGVHEPADAKGGSSTWADTEGVVPRELVDDPPPQDTSDDQTLKDDVMGEVTGDDDDAIDSHGGDQADATRDGGTGADVEDLEEGEPISRVDAPNLAAQTHAAGGPT